MTISLIKQIQKSLDCSIGEHGNRASVPTKIIIEIADRKKAIQDEGYVVNPRRSPP